MWISLTFLLRMFFFFLKIGLFLLFNFWVYGESDWGETWSGSMDKLVSLRKILVMQIVLSQEIILQDTYDPKATCLRCLFYTDIYPPAYL